MGVDVNKTLTIGTENFGETNLDQSSRDRFVLELCKRWNAVCSNFYQGQEHELELENAFFARSFLFYV